MNQHSVCFAARAAWSRYRRLVGMGGLCLTLATACISEVEIPPCVAADTCGQAGGVDGGGTAGASSGSAGASSVAGESSSGIGSNGGAGGNDDGDAGGVGEVGGDAGAGGGGAVPECKTCGITPAQLPSGCQGTPYEAQLTIQGGEAPYSWQLTPPVAGWAIASRGASTARVTTDVTPAGSTTLNVTATDARGLKKVATLRLRARSSCWFAYTALEGAQGKLHLIDPFLNRELVLANNQGVHDFKFSPDGTKLVYSHGASAAQPRGTALSLVDVISGAEQELAIEGAIESFAWSPDSTTLAVSFHAPAGNLLAAIRLAATTSEASPAVLTPIAAHAQYGLSWVGNRFVAYHAEIDLDADGNPTPNPERLHTPFYAELGATGFEPEVTTKPRFAREVTLRASDAGFYMLTNRSPPTQFFPLGGVTMTPRGHAQIALLAPSGEYTAVLAEDEPLTFLSAAQGLAGLPAAQAKEGDACHLVLAWAEQRERVACVVDVPNADPNVDDSYHGEVRFFDLPEQGDELAMRPLPGYCADDARNLGSSSCARGDQKYSYGVDYARNAARAFSPSGNWFAFTRLTDDDPDDDVDQVTDGDVYLYLSSLNSQSARFDRKIVIAGNEQRNRPSALSFSRDERLLLLQRGRSLWLVELHQNGESHLLSESVELGETPTDCREDFANAPLAYCGNTEAAAPFTWSPDSKSLALRIPNELVLEDVTSLTEIHQETRSAPDCGDACSGRFAFQPQVAAP